MQPTNGAGLLFGILTSRLQFDPRGSQGTGKVGLFGKAGNLLFEPGLTVDRLLLLVDHYRLLGFSGRGPILPSRPQIVEPLISGLQLEHIVD